MAERPALASVTVPVGAVDPISLYAAAVEADLEAALWMRPADGIALVGVGRAWATEPEGPDRFAEAERAWQGLLGAARVEGASPVLMGGLGFTGRPPGDDDVWAPFGAASLVLPQLVYALADDGRDPDGLGGRRSRRPRSAMGGARAAGPRARAQPERHRREARVRPARHRIRAAVARGLGSPRRHVRGGGRPRADRQGGAGPTRGPPVAGRARRRERPPPAGRKRPGEHDLRVPARRPDVPGLDARAARPNGWPVVPDDRGGRVDPAGRRRRRGRGPRRRSCSPRRRTARSRRSSSTRSAPSWRRSPRRSRSRPSPPS